MWIAIVYERTTTVITWNLRATKDEAVEWARSTFGPITANDPDDDAAALSLIEVAGYDIQIEEVTHLVTSTEYAIRLPNELVIKRTGDWEEAQRSANQADQKLREAGSPDRTIVVSRHAVYTPWQEVQ